MAATVRKSVIVTGIGRAVAPRLARLGRGVVRSCTRGADEMNETEKLRREGGDPVEDAVRRALAAAGERRGRLDGLVSNAGVTRFVGAGRSRGSRQGGFQTRPRRQPRRLARVIAEPVG